MPLFLIPIYSTQQYLKIYILSLIAIIACMSNGYGPGIRAFTKISEVPVGHLKSLGHNSVVYVDDSFLQREIYQACLDNISDTIKLSREQSSVIQTEKSVLTPSQTIAFLGFNISSKI